MLMCHTTFPSRAKQKSNRSSYRSHIALALLLSENRQRSPNSEPMIQVRQHILSKKAVEQRDPKTEPD